MVLDESDPDAWCTAVFVPSQPDSVLWRHCYWRGALRYDTSGIEFSPDGRLALAVGGQQTSGSRAFLAVLDAATGDVLARHAVVRCQVTGGCELATNPVGYNWERDGAPRPYRLAR